MGYLCRWVNVSVGCVEGWFRRGWLRRLLLPGAHATNLCARVRLSEALLIDQGERFDGAAQWGRVRLEVREQLMRPGEAVLGALRGEAVHQFLVTRHLGRKPWQRLLDVLVREADRVLRLKRPGPGKH